MELLKPVVKSPKFLTLFCFIVMLSAQGCATTSSVRNVEHEAQEAKQEADQSLAVAREAKQLAMEANSRSQQTDEIVTRSFKKSMYK